ncbi:MAG TPA: FmdB family zinc ribbon protein [Ktedonobacterales bacterium]|nr:FmdB family zinc ribbon protein [Ktedonobacterales bacterium]
MPTYEYVCRQCGHRFEAWQHMTDDPLTVCPKCGAQIHRVLYPAGIVFKGSGFYKTDNGSSGPVDKSSSTESKSGAGDSKPAASESKPTTESSKSDSSGSSPSPATTAAD